jgi:hypothetical protein
MAAIPDLPDIPINVDDPRTIAPTDIAQYLRLDQCARYLRLRLHERRHGRRFLDSFGVAPQSIPPILTKSGASFEDAIEGQVAALTAGSGAMKVVNCRDAAATDEEFQGEDHNAVVLRAARELPSGAVMFLFQPRLRVTLGDWQIRGDVDLLRLHRDGDGTLHVIIADMKSTTAAKVEHRLQVAFYHEMLAALFAAAELPFGTIQTAILYRGPADGTAHLTPGQEALQAEQRLQAQALFGVTDALLELVPTPENYRAEVVDLVTGPRSVAVQVAQADFAEVPYHLTYKCDGCLYNEFCMKWSAATDDLSLLPHLTDHEKNAIRAAGVTTMQELASLKEFRAPDAPDLVPAPGKEALVRKLGATPRVGPRLDELVHRARRYRRWKGDEVRALSYIPSKGHGSLPYCASDHNPNLVRVFIDAQHDYLHDRIYLLGALVAGCEGGAESPERRRSVVHMTDGAPEDAAQEQALFVRWIADTLQTVSELAAPDANGEARAPVHLIFYNRFAQRLLLDGLSRHFGAIAAATPLYDFVTQIAAYDSPLVSFLEHEIRELKNEPMVCQSLQAVARSRRFDWNQPEPYAEIFRTRMFDDRGRLVEDAEGPEAWYTSRARFNSQIPLEYAYAAWEALPEPPRRGHDDFASYRGATPELLRGFHARRLEAMEHITRDFRGNWTTAKTPFDLSQLTSFQGAARTLADGLAEFLALERHAELGAWKTAREAPPERRVLAGETLIVRYLEADQDPQLLWTLRANERRCQLHQEYTAAFLAANPHRKRATLTPAQKAETQQLDLPAPYRLRLDLTDVDCDLASALALTTLRPQDTLILAPRWIVDTRLPTDQQVPITPSAKRLLYSQRAQLVRVDATSGIVELTLGRANGFGKHPGYVFGTIGDMDEPLRDGARYTLDSDPNNWYGHHCAEIVAGLQASEPNTLYARLAHPEDEHADWPPVAAAAQQRFLAGLDALHAVGLLHTFDAHQRDYIAGHGDAPTLLVQGPPGTGKSYVTAFALLARVQGALAAGREYRVLVSCKTHAATNVLLEKLVEVQGLLRGLHERAPALFTQHIDPEVLDVPLLRVRPNENGAPAGVRAFGAEDDALGSIQGQRCCVVGATPGGVRGMLKAAGGVFGHDWCDCLVLDEASQMNLPEACMAALPLRDDGQLIVVGDHRQMPPIIKHGWGDERRRTFEEFRAFESLFVALRDRAPAPPIVRFAESFRLHRVMADFLREEIYVHDGIAYHSRRTALLPQHAHDDAFVASVLAPEHPLIVVVHGEATSQVVNPFEQALLAPVLAALADPERYALDHLSGLGVVVPHRAQRAALQEAVPQLAPRDPATGLIQGSAIDTVERFQGGERHAIVVSATESDRDYIRTAGDFLLDPRRLNVALSRAKEKMVLVASRSVFTVFNSDEETFANAQIWKNLLRRTCTVPLWQGVREGHHVEVWGCYPSS